MHNSCATVDMPNEGGNGIRGAPITNIAPARRVVALKMGWRLSKDISKGKAEMTWQSLKHEPVGLLTVLGNY